jgi:hypothetical protein
MVIPADYAQVNFIYEGVPLPNGAEWVVGVDIGGYADNPADLAQVAHDAAEGAGVFDLTSNDCFVSEVKVKFGPDATGPSGSIFPGTACTGGAAGDTPQMCALVKKNTPFGGRAGRGRTYVPCPPEGAVDVGGVINSSFLPQVTDNFEEFRTTMEGSGLFLVVLHGAGSPIVTPSVITSYSAQALGATQRRRLRG